MNEVIPSFLTPPALTYTLTYLLTYLTYLPYLPTYTFLPKPWNSHRGAHEHQEQEGNLSHQPTRIE